MIYLSNVYLNDAIDYTFQLPVFEGPLDLLLRLIEREELDITVVALAQVADQYLHHVRGLEAPDPTAISAFLVLAARLLVIKSRALLPRPSAARRSEDSVDEGAALAQQLREYQRYKQAAALLAAWQAEGRRSYPRTTPAPLPPPTKPERLDVTLDDMIKAVQRRLKLLRDMEPPAVPLPAPKIITVPEMMARIRERLATQAWLDFSDLLSLAAQRVEIVVALWATLELLKRRAISVEQRELFGPIMIGRGADIQNETDSV